MMNLESKLEEFKQLGMYAVSLTYGEDVGCDDSDVRLGNRRCVVLGRPVGCLGEAKIMFYGTVDGFLSADLKKRPQRISNPPLREEYKDGGYFIWGIADSVETILSEPFHGEWK